MSRKYAIVTQLNNIINDNKSFNSNDDKLLEIIKWHKTYCKNVPGVTQATTIIYEWVWDIYGFTNTQKIKIKYMQMYPLFFEEFNITQPNHSTIIGFEKSYGYGYPLNIVLNLIPDYLFMLQTKDDILNMYGEGTPQVKEAIIKLEKELQRQSLLYEQFFNETGLPPRFYTNMFKGSLSEFIEIKDPTKYIIYNDHYIVIDKIETWDRKYRGYQHGKGRLISTDRYVLIGKKGRITKYHFETYSNNFLLNLLNSIFDKKIKMKEELLNVDIDGDLYVRKWDNLIYDYKYVLKENIEYGIDPYIVVKNISIKILKDKIINTIWDKNTLKELMVTLGYKNPTEQLKTFCLLCNLNEYFSYSTPDMLQIIYNNPKNLEKFYGIIKCFKLYKE